MTCISPDADDFDPDAGFVKTEGDEWEGEDAELEVPKPSTCPTLVFSLSSFNCNRLILRHFSSGKEGGRGLWSRLSSPCVYFHRN